MTGIVTTAARRDDHRAQGAYRGAVSGVFSLVLLTASVVLGVAVSQRRQMPAASRYPSRKLHEYASMLALAFLALHILTTFDLLVAVVLTSLHSLGLGAAMRSGRLFDLAVACVVAVAAAACWRVAGRRRGSPPATAPDIVALMTSFGKGSGNEAGTTRRRFHLA